MSGQDATPELGAFAEQLRRLAPGEGKLDRDALLYRAGRASARASWLWPLTACASTLTAVVLGVMIVSRPPPAIVERVVYVPVEIPAPEVARDAAAVESPPAEAVYPVALEGLPPHRRLQEHLLRWGLDGLGELTATSAPAPTARDLFSHYSELSRGESIP